MESYLIIPNVTYVRHNRVRKNNPHTKTAHVLPCKQWHQLPLKVNGQLDVANPDSPGNGH